MNKDYKVPKGTAVSTTPVTEELGDGLVRVTQPTDFGWKTGRKPESITAGDGDGWSGLMSVSESPRYRVTIPSDDPWASVDVRGLSAALEIAADNWARYSDKSVKVFDRLTQEWVG